MKMQPRCLKHPTAWLPDDAGQPLDSIAKAKQILGAALFIGQRLFRFSDED